MPKSDYTIWFCMEISGFAGISLNDSYTFKDSLDKKGLSIKLYGISLSGSEYVDLDVKAFEADTDEEIKALKAEFPDSNRVTSNSISSEVKFVLRIDTSEYWKSSYKAKFKVYMTSNNVKYDNNEIEILEKDENGTKVAKIVEIYTINPDEFVYRGRYEQILLPAGTYLLDARGAGGGKTVYGGKGGRTVAKLELPQPTNICVTVGGGGYICQGVERCGGFNGGAPGSYDGDAGLRHLSTARPREGAFFVCIGIEMEWAVEDGCYPRAGGGVFRFGIAAAEAGRMAQP